MNEEEIITQIKDLIKDRESFICSTDDEDDIYIKDKEALERFIRII